MNPPRKRSHDRSRTRISLGLLCIAVGIVAAFPAAALAAPPPNDDFVNAQNLGSGSAASASGTNVDATAEPGEPDHADIPATASVWYRWTAPVDGRVRIDTCGSDFDTVLAVYTGSAVNALTPVAGNDDACGLQSRVRFDAAAGTTYRIAVDGFFGDQGSIELALAPATPPPNDDFADAQSLGSGSTASASGTNVDATAEPGEPDHAGIEAAASVWYRWTAPANRQVLVDTCGSDFDTVLAVYRGSALNSLTPVASNDDSCGPQSEVEFDATAGTTYRIAVDGFFGREGSIELELGEASSRALYVALGDSVAAGSGTYVERLFPYYRSTLGVTRLLNRAVGGETSGSIRTRGQLDRALADINATSDTRAVTIDIGGNDRFDCADRWASCPFRSNFSATLRDLRAALDADPGPEAFAVMAYYNPASGLGGDAPFSGEAWYERQLFGNDLVVDCEITEGPRVGGTDVVYQEAARHGALVADAHPAFKQGGQAFMADSVHPNAAGHAAIAEAFREAIEPCSAQGPPSNQFSFGKVKRNKRRGTAKLTVKVPGPGEVELAKTKRVKADEETAEAEGKEKLSVKPRRKARKRLNRKGKAKLRAKVTYTPDGGEPNTKSKRILLKKAVSK